MHKRKKKDSLSSSDLNLGATQPDNLENVLLPGLLETTTRLQISDLKLKFHNLGELYRHFNTVWCTNVKDTCDDVFKGMLFECSLDMKSVNVIREDAKPYQKIEFGFVKANHPLLHILKYGDDVNRKIKEDLSCSTASETSIDLANARLRSVSALAGSIKDTRSSSPAISSPNKGSSPEAGGVTSYDHLQGVIVRELSPHDTNPDDVLDNQEAEISRASSVGIDFFDGDDSESVGSSFVSDCSFIDLRKTYSKIASEEPKSVISNAFSESPSLMEDILIAGAIPEKAREIKFNLTKNLEGFQDNNDTTQADRKFGLGYKFEVYLQDSKSKPGRLPSSETVKPRMYLHAWEFFCIMAINQVASQNGPETVKLSNGIITLLSTNIAKSVWDDHESMMAYETICEICDAGAISDANYWKILKDKKKGHTAPSSLWSHAKKYTKTIMLMLQESVESIIFASLKRVDITQLDTTPKVKTMLTQLLASQINKNVPDADCYNTKESKIKIVNALMSLKSNTSELLNHIESGMVTNFYTSLFTNEDGINNLYRACSESLEEITSQTMTLQLTPEILNGSNESIKKYFENLRDKRVMDKLTQKSKSSQEYSPRHTVPMFNHFIHVATGGRSFPCQTQELHERVQESNIKAHKTGNAADKSDFLVRVEKQASLPTKKESNILLRPPEHSTEVMDVYLAALLQEPKVNRANVETATKAIKKNSERIYTKALYDSLVAFLSAKGISTSTDVHENIGKVLIALASSNLSHIQVLQYKLSELYGYQHKTQQTTATRIRELLLSVDSINDDAEFATLLNTLDTSLPVETVVNICKRIIGRLTEMVVCRFLKMDSKPEHLKEYLDDVMVGEQVKALGLPDKVRDSMMIKPDVIVCMSKSHFNILCEQLKMDDEFSELANPKASVSDYFPSAIEILSAKDPKIIKDAATVNSLELNGSDDNPYTARLSFDETHELFRVANSLDGPLHFFKPMNEYKVNDDVVICLEIGYARQHKQTKQDQDIWKYPFLSCLHGSGINIRMLSIVTDAIELNEHNSRIATGTDMITDILSTMTSLNDMMGIVKPKSYGRSTNNISHLLNSVKVDRNSDNLPYSMISGDVSDLMIKDSVEKLRDVIIDPRVVDIDAPDFNVFIEPVITILRKLHGNKDKIELLSDVTAEETAKNLCEMFIDLKIENPSKFLTDISSFSNVAQTKTSGYKDWHVLEPLTRTDQYFTKPNQEAEFFLDRLKFFESESLLEHIVLLERLSDKTHQMRKTQLDIVQDQMKNIVKPKPKPIKIKTTLPYPEQKKLVKTMKSTALQRLNICADDCQGISTIMTIYDYDTLQRKTEDHSISSVVGSAKSHKSGSRQLKPHLTGTFGRTAVMHSLSNAVLKFSKITIHKSRALKVGTVSSSARGESIKAKNYTTAKSHSSRQKGKQNTIRKIIEHLKVHDESIVNLSGAGEVQLSPTNTKSTIESPFKSFVNSDESTKTLIANLLNEFTTSDVCGLVNLTKPGSSTKNLPKQLRLIYSTMVDEVWALTSFAELLMGSNNRIMNTSFENRAKCLMQWIHTESCDDDHSREDWVNVIKVMLSLLFDEKECMCDSKTINVSGKISVMGTNVNCGQFYCWCQTMEQSDMWNKLNLPSSLLIDSDKFKESHGINSEWKAQMMVAVSLLRLSKIAIDEDDGENIVSQVALKIQNMMGKTLSDRQRKFRVLKNIASRIVKKDGEDVPLVLNPGMFLIYNESISSYLDIDDSFYKPIRDQTMEILENVTSPDIRPLVNDAVSFVLDTAQACNYFGDFIIPTIIAKEMLKIKRQTQQRVSHCFTIGDQNSHSTSIKCLINAPKENEDNYDVYFIHDTSVNLNDTAGDHSEVTKTTVTEDQMTPYINAIPFSIMTLVTTLVTKTDFVSLHHRHALPSILKETIEKGIEKKSNELSQLTLTINELSEGYVKKNLTNINKALNDLRITSEKLTSKLIHKLFTYVTKVSLPACLANDASHNVVLENLRFPMSQSLGTIHSIHSFPKKLVDRSRFVECQIHALIIKSISVHCMSIKSEISDKIGYDFMSKGLFIDPMTMTSVKSEKEWMNAMYGKHLYTRGLMDMFASKLEVIRSYLAIPNRHTREMCIAFQGAKHCLTKWIKDHEDFHHTEASEYDELQITDSCEKCLPYLEQYQSLIQVPILHLQSKSDLWDSIKTTLQRFIDTKVDYTYGNPYYQLLSSQIYEQEFYNKEKAVMELNDIKETPVSEFANSNSCIKTSSDAFNPEEAFLESHNQIARNFGNKERLPFGSVIETHAGMSKEAMAKQVEELKEYDGTSIAQVAYMVAAHLEKLIEGIRKEETKLVSPSKTKPTSFSSLISGNNTDISSFGFYVRKMMTVNKKYKSKEDIQANIMSKLNKSNEMNLLDLFKFDNYFAQGEDDPEELFQVNDGLNVTGPLKTLLQKLKLNESKVNETIRKERKTAAKRYMSSEIIKLKIEAKKEVVKFVSRHENLLDEILIMLPGINTSNDEEYEMKLQSNFLRIIRKLLEGESSLDEEVPNREPWSYDDICTNIGENYRKLTDWKKYESEFLLPVFEDGEVSLMSLNEYFDPHDMPEMEQDASELLEHLGNFAMYCSSVSNIHKKSEDPTLSDMEHRCREDQREFITKYDNKLTVCAITALIKSCQLPVADLFTNKFPAASFIDDYSVALDHISSTYSNTEKLVSLFLTYGENLPSVMSERINITIGSMLKSSNTNSLASMDLSGLNAKTLPSNGLVCLQPILALDKLGLDTHIKAYTGLLKRAKNKLAFRKSDRSIFVMVDHMASGGCLNAWKMCINFLSTHGKHFIWNIAPKAQFGGCRDLVVGDLHTKIFMGMVEHISKKILKNSENDVLEHPKKKTDLIHEHRDKFRTRAEYADGACMPNCIMCANSDETKWGPTHYPLSMANTLHFANSRNSTSRLITAGCILGSSKQIMLDGDLIQRVVNMLSNHGITIRADKVKDHQSQKYVLVKDGRDVSVSEALLQLNKTEDIVFRIYLIEGVLRGRTSIQRATHMGQGIYHATSSLASDVQCKVNYLLCKYLKAHNFSDKYLIAKLPEDTSVEENRSSDDSTTTFSSKTTDPMIQKVYFPLIYEMLTLLAALINVRKSAKHISGDKYYELYSTFTTCEEMVPDIKTRAAMITTAPRASPQEANLEIKNLMATALEEGASLFDITVGVICSELKRFIITPPGSGLSSLRPILPQMFGGYPRVLYSEMVSDPQESAMVEVMSSLKQVLKKVSKVASSTIELLKELRSDNNRTSHDSVNQDDCSVLIGHLSELEQTLDLMESNSFIQTVSNMTSDSANSLLSVLEKCEIHHEMHNCSDQAQRCHDNPCVIEQAHDYLTDNLNLMSLTDALLCGLRVGENNTVRGVSNLRTIEKNNAFWQDPNVQPVMGRALEEVRRIRTDLKDSTSSKHFADFIDQLSVDVMANEVPVNDAGTALKLYQSALSQDPNAKSSLNPFKAAQNLRIASLGYFVDTGAYVVSNKVTMDFGQKLASYKDVKDWVVAPSKTILSSIPSLMSKLIIAIECKLDNNIIADELRSCETGNVLHAELNKKDVVTDYRHLSLKEHVRERKVNLAKIVLMKLSSNRMMTICPSYHRDRLVEDVSYLHSKSSILFTLVCMCICLVDHYKKTNTVPTTTLPVDFDNMLLKTYVEMTTIGGVIPNADLLKTNSLLIETSGVVFNKSEEIWKRSQIQSSQAKSNCKTPSEPLVVTLLTSIGIISKYHDQKGKNYQPIRCLSRPIRSNMNFQESLVSLNSIPGWQLNIGIKMTTHQQKVKKDPKEIAKIDTMVDTLKTYISIIGRIRSEHKSSCLKSLIKPLLTQLCAKRSEYEAPFVNACASFLETYNARLEATQNRVHSITVNERTDVSTNYKSVCVIDSTHKHSTGKVYAYTYILKGNLKKGMLIVNSTLNLTEHLKTIARHLMVPNIKELFNMLDEAEYNRDGTLKSRMSQEIYIALGPNNTIKVVSDTMINRSESVKKVEMTNEKPIYEDKDTKVFIDSKVEARFKKDKLTLCESNKHTITKLRNVEGIDINIADILEERLDQSVDTSSELACIKGARWLTAATVDECVKNIVEIHTAANARDLVWSPTQDEIIHQSPVAYGITHPIDAHVLFKSVCDHDLKLKWKEVNDSVVKYTIVNESRTVVSAMENVISCLELENKSKSFSSDMLETYLLTSDIDKPQLKLNLLDVFGKVDTLRSVATAVVLGIKRQTPVTQQSTSKDMSVDVSNNLNCIVNYANEWSDEGDHRSIWGIESTATNLGSSRSKSRKVQKRLVKTTMAKRLSALQKSHDVRMECKIITKQQSKRRSDLVLITFVNNTSAAKEIVIMYEVLAMLSEKIAPAVISETVTTLLFLTGLAQLPDKGSLNSRNLVDTEARSKPMSIAEMTKLADAVTDTTDYLEEETSVDSEQESSTTDEDYNQDDYDYNSLY